MRNEYEMKPCLVTTVTDTNLDENDENNKSKKILIIIYEIELTVLVKMRRTIAGRK